MVAALGRSHAGTPLRVPEDRRSAHETVVGVLVAVTVLAVAAGSAWSARVKADASNPRWAALFALLAASAALALRCAAVEPVTRRELRIAKTAVVLVALMLVSAVWSVDPRLTIERGVTVAVVLATAVALGFAAARRPAVVEVVARGIVYAIAVLLLASLVLSFVHPSAAVQQGVVRFRGVEENPDTLPLLAALGLPLGAWLALETPHSLERIGLTIELLAVLGLMGATGSRGGLLAGLAGLLIVVWAASPRLTYAVPAAAAVTTAFAATVLLTPLMTHLPGAESSSAEAPPASTFQTTVTNSSSYFPLAMANELDRPAAGGRSNLTRNLFGSSGRAQAWMGAIEQADQRPWLGYGFGTEDHVFIDRYYTFEGDRPENSWIGMYLQLGGAGVIVLAGLFVLICLEAGRTLRTLASSRRLRFAAIGGVFVAGLVEMIVQSFVLSAGDIAMLSFWLCAGFLATAPEWAVA